MTTWLPAIVGVMYAITCIMWIREGDLKWALVWGGYSLAQIGLVMASYK